MTQIGFMLQHGLGEPANPKEAWCWCDWAEVKGEPHATTPLAELFLAGQRAVTDCSVLNKWPMKAKQMAVADRAPVPHQR